MKRVKMHSFSSFAWWSWWWLTGILINGLLEPVKVCGGVMLFISQSSWGRVELASAIPAKLGEKRMRKATFIIIHCHVTYTVQ